MKKLVLFSILLFSSISGVFAQGNNCAQATPFCEAPGGPGVTFPNSTGVTAATGPSYGCLTTQPNPAYFFIKTSAAGNMVYNISQTNTSGTGIDVDFVAWGPFATYSSMCNNLTGSCSPGGTALPQTCTGNIEDCSYSTSATEVMTLSSPGAGYFYLIMITNYAGVAGNITFSQTSGPASDCSITCPSALTGDGFLLTDGVTPVPSTVACGAAPFGIMASPNSAFGSPIVPGVMVSFLNNTNATNQISWYENGSYLGCFGPAASCGATYTLSPNTNTDLQWSYSSPSATTTFTLCETNSAQPNMNYTVTNLATHNVISTGTWNDDGSCQTITIAPGQITGVATFTASCGACISSTDYGYATFNPSIAGPGTHTVTYTFAPGGTCAPYVFTKTITIGQPTVSAVASSVTICQGSSTTLTASGTPSSPNVSFSNTTDFAISTSGTPTVTSPITVSGLSGTVGSTLVSVNLNIAHTWDSDLAISLQCPNGTIIALSTNNGSSGDNYVNTTFATGGAAITSGSAPYTGTFAPQQPFSGLSGCNLNGTWNLIVADGVNGDGGALYDWTITFTNQNTYTWSPAASVSPSTGASVIASPTVTTTYTVTATDASGCSKTNTVTVNVNPKPAVNAISNQTYCGGASVPANVLSSTPAGSSYTWTNSNTAIGLAASGSGNVPAFTAAAVSSTQTATITVTPTLSGCVGNPLTYTITVNPTPVITAMANVTNGCSGASLSVPNFTITPAGSANWTNNNTGIGLGASGTGNIGSFTAGSAGSGTITVNATSGSCSTPAGTTFVITVNPTPVITAMSNISVCGGAAVSVPAFTVTPSATATWTNSSTATGLSSASGTGNISGFTAASVGAVTTSTITVNSTLSGCAASPQTFNIVVNPTPVISAMSNITACGGSAVPAINYTVSPTATASWTNNNTATGIGASGSGNISSYTAPTVATITTGTITVNSTLGTCNATPKTFNVTINPTPVITAMSNISACGNASVSVPAFTVTPTATATWTNNNTGTGLASASGTGNISGFTAANVGTTTTGTITVNSSLSGCNAAPQTFNIVVNPTPSISAVSNVTACGGAAVSPMNFIVNPGGAVTWTNNNTATGINGSGSGNIAGYTAPTVGTVTTGTITLNAALGSCNATPVSYNVTINPTPVISAMSNITACGNTAVSVPAFTVTPSATATWTNNNTATGLSTASGSGNISGFTSANVSSVVSGTVTVNSSLAGCNALAQSFNITINPTPTIAAIANQTVCSGATVNAVSFSTTPATGVNFNWANTNTSIGLAATGTSNPINGFTASTVATQQQGVISVTPTLGTCVGPVRSYTVTVNPNPIITSTGTVTPSNCGASTGAINGVTATGAPALSYSWNGGASQPTSTLTNIPAGSYNLVVTDGNGCTTNSAFSVGNPGAPTAPTLSINNPAVCVGGSATLSINSPVGGTIYSWTGPTGSLGTGNSINITNATLADGGNYTASATASGCTGPQSSATVLTVNPNPVPLITPTTTSFCEDATIIISATTSNPGGTATIPAGGYQWTIGGNPIPGATSSTYTATVAGNYGLTITNSNGCTASASVSAALSTYSEPTLSSGSASIVNSNCVTPTGSVTGVSISGGTSGYTYTWYNASSSVVSTSTTSSDLTGQSAGNYTLIVVDANGCNDTILATINNDNAPSAPLVASNAANCSGNTMNPVSVTGSGGTITWYSDAGLTNVLSTSNPYTPTTVTTHTLYVTETTNGCQSGSTQVVVTVNPTPAAPTATGASYCVGQTVADLVATGGSGTLNWYSDAGLTTVIGTGSPFASGISTTTTVYVAETAIGCLGAAVPVTVVINTLPTINTTSLTVDSASCGGISDGNINGIAVGGTPSFTYVWSNASGNVSTSTTTPDLINQPSGTYTLTVTDGNGCVSSQGPITLNSTSVPSTPVFVVATSDTVYCAGDAVTALTATATSGNVFWYSDVALTNQIGAGNTITPTGITSNTTIYVVANNSNCISAPRPVTITFNPLPSVSANNPSTCAGGSVTLNGTGAVSYTWDNGVTNGVSFIPNATANYIVTGTDANSCVNTATVTVTVNPLPTVGATQGATTAVCSGGNITLNGTGASTYSWSNGVVDGVPFTPSTSGSYTVTGTDANGCLNTFAVAVTVNSLPTVDAGALNDTLPCGSNNYVLNGASTNASSPQYVWTGPNVVANGTTANPTIGAAGTYTLVVTDGVTGCVAQDVINMVSNTVVANFTQDVTSGFNPLTVNFTNQSTGALSYNWVFGNGTSSTATNPSTVYNSMGTYQVVLTAFSNGCSDTATVTILVSENSSIVIPNIFSPNGDGVNDILTITSTGIKEINIDIFNRWGQKVFVISAPGQNWDGKLSNGNDAAEGTYFYILKAIGYDTKEYTAQGPVMLVK